MEPLSVRHVQGKTDAGVWPAPWKAYTPYLFAKIKPVEARLNFCMINTAYSEEETYGIAPV